MRFQNLARKRYQSGQLILDKDSRNPDKDRWTARWREDVMQPDGTIKRVRKWDVIAMKRDCPTKRLAQRILDEKMRIINRKDDQTVPVDKPVPVETFSGFADRWMDTVMIHHKPSSQRSERDRIGRHLKSAFGTLPTREISAEMLQTWVSELKFSPKTILNIVTTFRMMWKTATAWGYVQHNPFEGLRLPTVTKGNVYHFSLGEAAAIIAEAKGWYKIFFELLAETGMRPGEAAGLRPEDIDGRVVHVRQSVWRGNIQTLKTPNAVRALALSVGMAEQIQQHISESKPNGDGLIFVNKLGRPLKMDNFNDKVLNPILDRLGIRAKVKSCGVRCGNYAFRHMNATVMDSVLKTPIKTRQKRLGHADIATTLTHYTEAVDADDLAAAEQMGALLTPQGNDAGGDAKQEGAIEEHPEASRESVEAHVADDREFWTQCATFVPSNRDTPADPEIAIRIADQLLKARRGRFGV